MWTYMCLCFCNCISAHIWQIKLNHWHDIRLEMIRTLVENKHTTPHNWGELFVIVAMVFVQDVLDEWLNCQRAWLYLEPIFSSEDINRQLPVESKRYQTMERMWRKMMKNAKENPQVHTQPYISFLRQSILIDTCFNCSLKSLMYFSLYYIIFLAVNVILQNTYMKSI